MPSDGISQRPQDSATPVSGDRLYCDPDVWDEYFFELEDWIEAFAQICSPGNRRLTVIEYDCYPPGDTGSGRVPDGATLAEQVAEDFGDVCEWSDLYEQYAAAAERPEVIAAFNAARAELVKHQTFRCARNEIDRHEIWLTVGEGFDHNWGYWR